MTATLKNKASLVARFLSEENGAVTVDWVVLTALITGAGMILFSTLTPAVYEQGASGISDVVLWSIQR